MNFSDNIKNLIYNHDINKLYENYLKKFKIDKIITEENSKENISYIDHNDDFMYEEYCDDELDHYIKLDNCDLDNSLEKLDTIRRNKSKNIDTSIKDECVIKKSISPSSKINSFYTFLYEDQVLSNKLTKPHEYLHNLINEKVDFNFKGLSNYNVDRSYLNRILKGNIPSKYLLVNLGYFLQLDLDEISELFNVYGYAFGNSLNDKIIYYAFKNNLKYLDFLDVVDQYGSKKMVNFFMK